MVKLMKETCQNTTFKEWKKPVLTQFGTIKKLTMEGGGPGVGGPNQGSNKTGGSVADVFGGFCS